MTSRNTALRNKLRNKRVLVTGADGFVGSHLMQALKEKGARVEAFKGDILAAERLGSFDFVFHLAAITDLKQGREHPYKVFEVNVLGTLRLLENLEGRPKFIYASTLGVYGEPKALPLKEDSPTIPIEPYAASKLAGETAVAGFCRSREIPYAIVRFFNVYGKGQRRDFVIPSLIEQILKNDTITVRNPKSTRDFVYIDDIVEGLIAAALRGKDDVYNLGTGKETSIREVAQHIKRFTNKDTSFILERDSSDRRVKRSRADVKKAKKELGWSAKTGLKEGIKKLLS